MIVVLAFAIFSALFWAGFKYYAVYFALVDSFPPEWRNTSSARVAIDQFALSPSTPLAVQADYVASQVGACLAAFFLWLLVFLVGQTIERWLFLAILLVFVVSTVKSARLYWKNRNRSMIGSQEENI
jgi:Ca2+/Na+ antiporter